jgi:hypothetical protein
MRLVLGWQGRPILLSYLNCIRCQADNNILILLSSKCTHNFYRSSSIFRACNRVDLFGSSGTLEIMAPIFHLPPEGYGVPPYETDCIYLFYLDVFCENSLRHRFQHEKQRIMQLHLAGSLEPVCKKSPLHKCSLHNINDLTNK